MLWCAVLCCENLSKSWLVLFRTPRARTQALTQHLSGTQLVDIFWFAFDAKPFEWFTPCAKCMDFLFVRACLACEWRETNENYIVLIKRVIGNSWDSNFPDDVSYLKWKYVRVVHLRFGYALSVLLIQLSVYLCIEIKTDEFIFERKKIQIESQNNWILKN